MLNYRHVNEKQLFSIIKHVVEEEIEIDIDTKLIESGLIDSLRLLSLISEIESVLGFTMDINNVEIEDFETPGKILLLIQKVLNY